MSPTVRALLIIGVCLFIAYGLRWQHQKPSEGDLVGVASVIDGDTIEIHNTRIRLSGMDAPETKQFCEANGERYACGQRAAFALSDMIGRSTITCRGEKHDRYKRTLARCFLGDRDIQAEMVRQGWAIAYRRYSADYVADEDAARLAKVGLWAGTFVEPERWRHDKTARK